MLTVGLLGVLLAGCGGGGDAVPSPSTTPTAPPVAPLAKITTNQPDRAVNVSPLSPITVAVADGTLDEVALSTRNGAVIPGHTAPDGKSWQTTAPLAYSETYTINTVARSADEWAVTRTTSFDTVAPRTLTYASMNPLDGQTVGVGQPIAIYFDEPITDKKAAESAITVTTNPKVDGAFYWFSNKEVHWRPQEFWASGTHVTVDFKIFGKDFGNGVYGQENRTVNFVVGDSVISRADGASHQMTVAINGQVVRTMPISMGKASFPSNNGTHVVTEQRANMTMDSTTFGLALDAGGYIAKVQWATRISNGGEFVHSAPWSVGQQGYSNVSHGCINVSPANAKWFFDTVKKGDVVITTNTGGPNLQSWDGFGDWQLPWDQWVAGGNS